MQHNFLTIVLDIFLAIVLVLAIFLLTLALTGRVGRAYEVLDPEASLEVGGKPWYVADLAASYQPVMHLHESHASPPLMWVWYEAVPSDAKIDLVYYFAWEGEVNPNPMVDRLYALFRAAYYGYPIHDIEYFQISLDRVTGEVVGLLFETSPEDNFEVVLSEHLVARYTRASGGNFSEVITDKEGQVLSQREGMPVLFDGMHPRVIVQTWNHLTRVLRDGETGYQALAAPLKPLTEAEYASYKFARKSQGDHQTKEKSFIIPVIAFITVGVVFVPVWFINKLRRKTSPQS